MYIAITSLITLVCVVFFLIGYMAGKKFRHPIEEPSVSKNEESEEIGVCGGCKYTDGWACIVGRKCINGSEFEPIG